MSVGDQVKVTGKNHPWAGAIGRILEKGLSGMWVVELETISPGHRCAALPSELRRV